MFDLDQYYTPEHVASEMAEASPGKPSLAVDTACGNGSLLLAAERVFSDVSCAGIDKDASTIRRLKRLRPDWKLSIADFLNQRAVLRARAVQEVHVADLLLLNPPFSHQRRKSTLVCYDEQSVNASVSMAHLLRAIEVYQPSLGVVAVVPESLLYSDVDDLPRRLLSAEFGLKVVRELESATFRGARARSAIVQLARKKTKRLPLSVAEEIDTLKLKFGLELRRGGLPVHEAEAFSRGLVLVHSTDLRELGQQTRFPRCRVRPIERGIVGGNVILVPRVGLPCKEALAPVLFHDPVQLSDCVIALRFGTKRQAIEFASRMRRNFSDFISLYRGTGARYLTMGRLSAWCERLP